jgi:hypothetical protein
VARRVFYFSWLLAANIITPIGRLLRAVLERLLLVAKDAPVLTSDVCGGTLPSTWGDVAVQRHCRILVLFLMAGVFGGSAVPPVDLPETTFNESDAPVNLALPSQAPLSFVRPVT